MIRINATTIKTTATALRPGDLVKLHSGRLVAVEGLTESGAVRLYGRKNPARLSGWVEMVERPAA
jgi:hypothetical protein